MSSEREREEWRLELAGRLKARRMNVGMTQEQLSEKTGIAPQHLSRLETARQLPTLDTLVRLARALDTTVSFLLGEPREPGGCEPADRIAAALSTLPQDDSAFVESQIASLISHLRTMSHR